MEANMIHVRKTGYTAYVSTLYFHLAIVKKFSPLSLSTSQTFSEDISSFIFHIVSQSNFISGIFTFYNIKRDSCIKNSYTEL